jgi:hypothetical protein
MLSRRVSPSVTVSTSKDGKSITVTSDKFALAASAVRDSQRQEMSVIGVRGQAFADCAPSGKTAKRDMDGELSLANIVLAIRLWREGLPSDSHNAHLLSLGITDGTGGEGKFVARNGDGLTVFGCGHGDRRRDSARQHFCFH